MPAVSPNSDRGQGPSTRKGLGWLFLLGALPFWGAALAGNDTLVLGVFAGAGLALVGATGKLVAALCRLWLYSDTASGS